MLDEKTISIVQSTAPVLSMLHAIVSEQSNRQVTFIHAARNSQYHPFKNDVKQLENNHTNLKSLVCYDFPTEEGKQEGNYDKEGYIDLDFLTSNISTKNADFYFCGPLPFMEAIINNLEKWGVPAEHMHYESFSPVAILGEE